MVPILKDKARQGVEVRILCDGMGGRFVPKALWKELEETGIFVGIFFPPILGSLNLRVNYRNHRKIVVIDNQTGYVGGFNIGKEYIGKDKKFGYWRDTHLKIRGGAVISLQIRFALDWNYAVKENLFLHAEYFDDNGEMENIGPILSGEKRPLGIQIITSGPDVTYKSCFTKPESIFTFRLRILYQTTRCCRHYRSPPGLEWTCAL